MKIVLTILVGLGIGIAISSLIFLLASFVMWEWFYDLSFLRAMMVSGVLSAFLFYAYNK